MSRDEALALHPEIKGLLFEDVAGEVPDLGLLESALARPRNAALYEHADIAAQTATLLCGLAENQPFMPGADSPVT